MKKMCRWTLEEAAETGPVDGYKNVGWDVSALLSISFFPSVLASKIQIDFLLTKRNGYDHSSR